MVIDDENEITPEEEGQDQREGDDQPDEREKRAPAFKKATNAKEMLLEEVVHRARRSDGKLRAHLAGKIAVEIQGPNSGRYLFEWTADSLTSKEDRDAEAECTISLNEQNLMKIAQGDLNPQIAILSKKIAVKGHLESAIYFFNLVAPRMSHG